MKLLTITTIFISFIVLGSQAYAGGPYSPGIDKRQHRQVQRIKHGVRNGSLTGRETIRLGAEQGRIRHMERRFKSDGVLSARERGRLHRRLNRSSRHIFRQKHDRQNR